MQNKIIKLSKNTFIRGGFILTIATFFINFSSYFFYILIAHASGPKGYGEVVTLFSYVTVLSIPVNIISTIIIRRLGFAGEHRLDVAVGFEHWFFLKLKKLWFLFPVFLASSYFIPQLTNLNMLSGITLIVILFLGLVDAMFIALLQGIRSFGLYSLSLSIPVIFKLLGAIVLFIGFGNFTTIYVFLILGLLAAMIPAIIHLRKIKPKKRQDTYVLDKRISALLTDKSTLITIASLIGITLLGNLDIIFVKKLFSASDSGIYGAWSLFAKTILFFIGPVQSILLVFFSSAETQKNQKKTMILLGILFIIGGITVSIFYSIFGHVLISIVLGKQFTLIEPLLGKAAVFGTTYAAVLILNSYFIARKSNLSLIGVITIPIYIMALILMGHSLNNFISINIYYTITLTVLYVIAYYKSLDIKMKYEI